MLLSTRKRGFTFLEIMLVVMIIGLLAAVVGPKIVQQGESARKRQTKIQIDAVSNALKQYALDVGGYPTSDQGLKSLIAKPSDVDEELWDGPYIDTPIVPKDGWSKELFYAYPSTHDFVDFDLYSSGPDRVENNEDDITNWVKK
jgi:general secretion pathway protein G